jgi:hypothetical protein
VLFVLHWVQPLNVSVDWAAANQHWLTIDATGGFASDA